MMGKKPIICGHCCDPHWTKGLLSTLPLVLAVLIETVEVGGSCVYFSLSSAFTDIICTCSGKIIQSTH